MDDTRSRAPRLPTIRELAVLAVASAVTLGTAGCGGAASPSHKSAGSPGASQGSPSAHQTPVTQNKVPAKVANKAALRKHVSVTACHAGAGGWEASGTATNTTSAPATYTVTIFFTTPRATVQDFAVAKVAVAPGATSTWTASKAFRASQGTLCVVRGVS